MCADRERRGESGRFDAVEIDHARDTVILRPLNHEIDRGIAFRGDPGTDTGVSGLERTVFQSRVVAADGLVEPRLPAFVEMIIEAVGPAEIRAELAAAAQIDRHVHAEPVVAGDGINEMAE